jgi:phosphocarrier protein HPr
MKITHKEGLHARPAALFVQLASKYKADIWMIKESKRVNAKSIMGVLSLGVTHGSEIALTLEGPDEVQAAQALQRLIASNFTEASDPHET